MAELKVDEKLKPLQVYTNPGIYRFTTLDRIKIFFQYIRMRNHAKKELKRLGKQLFYKDKDDKS